MLEKEENAQDCAALTDLCEKILQQAITKLNLDTTLCADIQREVCSVVSELEPTDIILGLSLEEKRLVNGQLYGLMNLDKNDVLINRQEVRESIVRSKNIREIIA